MTTRIGTDDRSGKRIEVGDIDVVIFPSHIAQVRLVFPAGGLVTTPLRSTGVLHLTRATPDAPEYSSASSTRDGHWRVLNLSALIDGGIDQGIRHFDDPGIIAFLARIYVKSARLSGHEALLIEEFLLQDRLALAPEASKDEIVRRLMSGAFLMPSDQRLSI